MKVRLQSAASSDMPREKGDLLGRLHDFSHCSSPGLEIRAHKAGVVIAMLFAARCEKGITLYVIGEDAA